MWQVLASGKALFALISEFLRLAGSKVNSQRTNQGESSASSLMIDVVSEQTIQMSKIYTGMIVWQVIDILEVGKSIWVS